MFYIIYILFPKNKIVFSNVTVTNKHQHCCHITKVKVFIIKYRSNKVKLYYIQVENLENTKINMRIMGSINLKT